MSEQIKCQPQPIPAYSGITINIMNPTLNAGTLDGCGQGANLNAVGINVIPQNEAQKENAGKTKYATRPENEISPNGYYSRAEIEQSRKKETSDSKEVKAEHEQDKRYGYSGSEETKSEHDQNKSDRTSDKQNLQTNTIKEKETVKETLIQNNDTSKEQQASQTQTREETSRQNETRQNDSARDYANEKQNETQQNTSAQTYTEDRTKQTENKTAGVNEGVNDSVNNRTNNEINNGANGKNNTDTPAAQNNDRVQTPVQSTNTANEPVQNQQAGITNNPQEEQARTAENTPKQQNEKQYNEARQNSEENDLTTSQQIIEMVDSENAKEKELKENGKKVKVVALTNEYIMSLENYLNNPNTDIRLMAAKDILTRLDEDRDRYDDAALNALLNKMLQDPSKLVRIAALSALSADLASGNDYTVQLLNQIQQDPKSDQQDVLEAAQIMLNRSAKTEIRYIRTENYEQQAEE